MTGVNAWAGKPWPEADRVSLTEEMRRWLVTWKRGEPCRDCGWPFPDAPYHVHDLGASRPEGPVRDD